MSYIVHCNPQLALTDRRRMLSALLTPDAAAAELSISRTVLYGLIAQKTISSIKIGRSRRIPRAALDQYIATQVAEQSERPNTGA